MVNELYHYGVKGMKWGVRRYQNPDGTLKSEGRKRLTESKRYQYLLKNSNPTSINPTKEELNNYMELWDAIQNKSGDWYSGKAVSENFKKAVDAGSKFLEEYHNIPWTEETKELRKKMSQENRPKINNMYIEAVLKDLNLPLTDENKELIKYWIFID